MLIADSFMDAPAWGFWGAVIAVVGIPIGVWAAFRAGEGQTKLFYDFAHVGLRQAGHNLGGLEISRAGVALKEPEIATLSIKVASRRDISAERFSKGQPLAFELGAPILDVLKTRYSAADGPTPSVRHDGSRLEIGPDLLHRNSGLTVTVLVDGNPHLRPPQRTLEDVKLTRGGPARTTAQEWARTAGYLPLTMLISVTVSSYMGMRGLNSFLFAGAITICTSLGFRGGLNVAMQTVRRQLFLGTDDEPTES